MNMHQTTLPPILEVSGLRISVSNSFTAGGNARTKTVVHGIDLHVDRGTSVGIVGESGSGKTLSVMSVADLLPHGAQVESGSIKLLGREITSLSGLEKRRWITSNVGVIFQNPQTSLNHRLTIGKQLAEALSDEERADKTVRQRRLRELLDLVQVANIEKTLSAFPHELSGGLNQRAAIAMALAKNPQLLIADEATTALDASIQLQILRVIDELKRELSLSVLFVSHDIGVIADHTDQMYVMKNGVIMESGLTRSVLHNPASSYTSDLLNASPVLLNPVTPPDKAVLAEKPTLLRLDHVSHNFKSPTSSDRKALHPALVDVSLSVVQGQTIGIVGESGSGKTTLARIIAGLLPQQQGTLDFAGQGNWRSFNRLNYRQWRSGVQYVFQDPYSSLDPRMTVEQSLLEPLELSGLGLSRAQARARVSELLLEVELDPGFAKAYPASLSGGQRQRVAIGRALATQPRLLIADEPVSALDLTVQARILELLKELVTKRNLTLVMISHDLSVIRYLCERVVVMRDGRIVEEGLTSQIFEAPRDAYTKLLLDAVPGKALYQSLRQKRQASVQQEVFHLNILNRSNPAHDTLQGTEFIKRLHSN